MTQDSSRRGQAAPPAQKLEDRYGKIGIPAVAAAVSRPAPAAADQRQMSAEAAPAWTQVTAQS